MSIQGFSQTSPYFTPISLNPQLTALEHGLEDWCREIGIDNNQQEQRRLARQKILDCHQQNTTDLDLSRLWLTSIPKVIGELKALQHLNLSHNQLTTIPSEIGQLQALQHLNLYYNQLTTIPSEIGQLRALQYLNLCYNQLSSLPSEIGQLQALQYLNLCYNQLSSLPSEIGQLQALEELYLSGNQLRFLPAEIGQLTALEELYLSDNQLSSLPSEIGQLQALKQLRLSGNQLSSLPSEIGQLQALEYLDLENNPRLRVSSFNPPNSLYILAYDDSFWANGAGQWGRCTHASIRNIATTVHAQAGLVSTLEGKIKEWMALEQIPESFAQLLAHEEKAQLASLLHKLEMTNDYKVTKVTLQLRVQNILTMAAIHVDRFYALVGSALESCGDGVAHELDNLQCALHLESAKDMPKEDLAEFLVRYRRLSLLTLHVAAAFKDYSEALENSFALRLMFKEWLPPLSQSMLYERCAQLSPQSIETAKTAMLQGTQEIEDRAELLCEYEVWTDKLHELDGYSQELDELTQSLDFDSDATDAAFTANAAQLEERFKALKLLYTDSFLRTTSLKPEVYESKEDLG